MVGEREVHESWLALLPIALPLRSALLLLQDVFRYCICFTQIAILPLVLAPSQRQSLPTYV
jgi:hypothetical protein